MAWSCGIRKEHFALPGVLGVLIHKDKVTSGASLEMWHLSTNIPL
jgi:hypothetical protein